LAGLRRVAPEAVHLFDVDAGKRIEPSAEPGRLMPDGPVAVWARLWPRQRIPPVPSAQIRIELGFLKDSNS
jgi:hypothetical protein